MSAGVACFLIAYAGFAATGASIAILAACFLASGVAIGCVETAEHAAVAQLAPEEIRGSAFGLLAGVQSLGTLIASVTAGVLWTAVSPAAGLLFAAALMAVALACLAWGARWLFGSTQWLIVGLGAAAAVYAAAVLALVVAGRRSDARALAGFIPDCVVLVKRLLSDPRVPRRRKVLLVLLAAYLAMPIDLVPDFIPVAGQLDDAILVAVVLRAVLRLGGEQLLREHWSGPPRSLELVRRLAFGGPARSPRG